MGKRSFIEELIPLRNIRFHYFRKPLLTTRDIEQMAGGGSITNKTPNKPVSFIGFNNEFDDIIGKNCVYIQLDDSEEEEWRAKRAVRYGANAVISEHQIEQLPCIVVNDVWKTLVDLSKKYLEQYQGGITAIAGSIGKTTTKEMVECVYRRKFRTFCTPNNGNVLAYLAYEIQHMPYGVEQFIQEVDESYPDNAARCSFVLQPQIAIITTIDKSHIGAIGGEDAVEKAIVDIAKYVPETGTVIINRDDPKSREVSFHRKTLSIAINDPSADCTASDIVCGSDSVDFVIRYQGEAIPIHLNCPGVHNVYNAMSAFLAGRLNGMDNSSIQKGLESYRPMTIRQRAYRSFGKKLYVDCYNASSRSIAVALSVLKEMVPSHHGRRIAVLGDVAEIEGYEDQTYREIAEEINNADLDVLITYGCTSEQIWSGVKSGLAGQHISAEDKVVAFLKKELHRGDVIMFKGSHSVHLENVVKKAFPIPYYWGKIPYWIKHGKWIAATI